MTKRNLGRGALLFFLIAGIGVAVYYRDSLDAAAVEAWVEQAGLWAPTLFMLLYAMATVFFLPGVVFTIAGGALFGPVCVLRAEWRWLRCDVRRTPRRPVRVMRRSPVHGSVVVQALSRIIAAMAAAGRVDFGCIMSSIFVRRIFTCDQPWSEDMFSVPDVH